jgi:sugar phosphate isomerase/epimerase
MTGIFSDNDDLLQNGQRKNALTLALNVRWDSPIERFERASRDGFAFEYTPSPTRPELSSNLSTLLTRGIPVRYHGFFPEHELAFCGGPDDSIWQVYTGTLTAMRDAGCRVITVHINLDPSMDIDRDRATDNLARVVAFADSLGITVALENLGGDTRAIPSMWRLSHINPAP